MRKCGEEEICFTGQTPSPAPALSTTGLPGANSAADQLYSTVTGETGSQSNTFINDTVKIL